jgi:hypothetical protein
MSDEIKKEGDLFTNFDEMFPGAMFGSHYAEADQKQFEKDKTGASNPYSGTVNTSSFLGMNPSSNILRNPSRRFYDPEITTTAIFLPKDIKRNNRWCRWFYDHDEVVGAVLDVHAELPYSKARIKVKDPIIQREIEDCLDRTNFFSMLPLIDLEYMKVGEVFINNHWNDSLGMWDNIVIHNPDYMEVKYSPFADQESVIELTPDQELRSLIYSTRPEDQRLKKRLPADVVKRVLTGRNIILNPDEITHIARRSNPYDIRGTSMIRRLFRVLQYQDKLRESQITIADNFIYPLKLFKLGDKQRGWIPNANHQKALAQMLQQANFDPNFSLIYHYGLEVEYITVADKILKLDKEWTQIDEMKFIALGVSKEFLTSGTTYAAANVGLQTQLARYRAKRDLFELRWIRDKFFRIMAERNGWYTRDAREITGQFRVGRSKEELRKRLILPELIWDKKLAMRDDSQYLTFLNNVYAQGKGPISVLTLLMAMGLTLDDELSNKEKQKELEEKFGLTISPPPAAGGAGGAGAPPPPGIASRIMDKIKKGSKKEEEVVQEKEREFIPDGEFTKQDLVKYGKITEDDEIKMALELSKDLFSVDEKHWLKNLKSDNLSKEVITLFTTYNDKLATIHKRSNGNFINEILSSLEDVNVVLSKLYIQGKLSAYELTNFLPIHTSRYSNEIKDFSDLVLIEEFKNWIEQLCKSGLEKEDLFSNLRNISNTCFAYGQLKGYQEQGINRVRIANVIENDGLRYDINTLLSHRHNLASIVSPQGDIALFNACIENEEDIESTLDPHIARYKDFAVNGIKINNCPIEFIPSMTNYISKVGKLIKRKYDSITFIDDITNAKAWEDSFKKAAEKEFTGINIEMQKSAVASALMQEKLKKQGNLAIFNKDRDLYLAHWLGTGDKPLVDNLIRHIDVYDEYLDKLLSKSFDKTAFNLSRQEIDTYSVFKYITPVSDNDSKIIGWKLIDGIEKEASINEKLKSGKIWNSDGICLNKEGQKTKIFFTDNLKLWIDYPHKLDETYVNIFNKLM